MNYTLSFLGDTDLIRYMPKVIIPAIIETLTMVIVSAIFSIIFGIIFGIILFITDINGLKPNKIINAILGKITDILRAFPIMILIVALTPITRAILGSKIGIVPAIFTITIGCIPFATRMAENAFSTVDNGVIKASKVFGATDFQIITKVILVEALPSLIQNYTIMIINLLNMSAIAGAVGAGGLGAVALTYGYQRFDYAIMYFIVILLILLVMVIQKIGNIMYNKVK
ncbi:MAG: ABC transporter permease subunit [Finegoldia magna]|uniref:methionine ABC transporter permease n=1 Tax=Finegoldia magna TaxID=1260 RepID=UPI00290FEAEB|nr:ABC transporter permease subunit [Finegoldia magna]MDU7478608.1 ABC transporter permease subunit [Finegoldia magna]MDU7501901.1 ABC transporter permease subunit [Finegoldia magna]